MDKRSHWELNTHDWLDETRELLLSIKSESALAIVHALLGALSV